jgi:uncharacterized protein YjbI with pentapeptide repeats
LDDTCSQKLEYYDFGVKDTRIYECPEKKYSKDFCRFHEKDYATNETTKKALIDELNQMIKKAGESDSVQKWIGYHFPTEIDFRLSHFKGKVYLDHAEFLGDAIFEHSYFENDVSFDMAVFHGHAHFSSTVFMGRAYFTNTAFNKGTDFSSAKFNKMTKFGGDPEFILGALFIGTHFNGSVEFDGRVFREKANFFSAEFNKPASFSAVVFNGEADFHIARFKEDEWVDFSYAQFNGEATFSKAQLNKADFSHALFKHGTFDHVDFKDEVEFSNVEFPSTDKQYLFDWDFIVSGEGKPTLVMFLNDILTLDSSKVNLTTEMSKDNKTIKILSNPIGTTSQSSSASLYYTFKLDEKKSRIILKPASNNKNNDRKSYRFIAERRDDKSIKIYNPSIPIKFDYATFRKRARFTGEPNKPLQLGFVSFVGVDMTNIEFSNVKWKSKEEKFLKIVKVIERDVIIDEEHLEGKNNYGEVSRIYNQLRKNYETRLLFNEASNFFIGEMESIRKSLRGEKEKWLRSIPYWIYKWLALYGESIRLPLIVWTLILIAIFTAARVPCDPNTIPPYCSTYDKIFVDSIAAYFQIPRSDSNIDIIERIASAPVLATAFIALRRRFERSK